MMSRFLGYMLKDTMMKSTAPAFKKLKMELETEKRTQAIQTQSKKYNVRGKLRRQSQTRG